MLIERERGVAEFDVLNLGAGEDTAAERWDVDQIACDGVDQTVDLDDMPWPWDSNSWALIRAEHVIEHLDDVAGALAECARLLEPGGRLRVTVPMGLNAIADPDHKHVWTWLTPEFYCGARHWDVDVGLEVIDRRVSLHSHDSGISRALRRAVWAYQLQRFGPGQWCFNLPTMSGEFTVVFEKP